MTILKITAYIVVLSPLTHLFQKFKKGSDFYKTSKPKGREKNIYEISSLSAA